MSKPHFSSLRMDWKTPKAAYQILDAEFDFDHDPCPAGWDGKVDGLNSSWGGLIMLIHHMGVSCQNGLPRVLVNGKKEKRLCF